MTRITDYFLLDLPVSAKAWSDLDLELLLAEDLPEESYYRMQVLAERMRQRPETGDMAAGQLQLLGLLCRVFRELCRRGLQSLDAAAVRQSADALRDFVELYPPERVLRGLVKEDFLEGEQAGQTRRLTLAELFILAVQCENPAARKMRLLFDDTELEKKSHYRSLLTRLDRQTPATGAGLPAGTSLLELLRRPILAAPDSLAAQLSWVADSWADLLPPELLKVIPANLSLAAAEGARPTGGAGTPLPPGGGDAEEPEAFSPDAGWMPDVVLIAKSTHVWLHQLSQRYDQEIQRLDHIPAAELDILAEAGFNALWLIGLWERSPASGKLKQLRGNPDAKASAYALYDYSIAWELGGEDAFHELSRRCGERGIRLCGDVVPNHTGLYSRWIKEHPDWYIQLDHPPYAAYRFNGPNLTDDSDLELVIDDGYYDHSDAAVVFRHHDRRNGRTRFIYHGNDGTHMPWNDTAQLNYLLPEVREAMVRTIISVARRFPLIRFDAAMTLAKKHFQRLWYPLPGGGAGVPSRALHALSQEEFDTLFPVEFWREVVDRVAAEAPGTLLLAEAFWLLEGYFVRTLGMHRVYNSAFMNMLKREENAKYRQVIKETLEFNPRILQRFVNFMNNPDEATAVEQFGKGDKYFGVTVLLATLPGLPLFGHGQVEGLREKYGMEYARPQLNEEVDQAFLRHHHSQIFPLLRRRALFSDSEHFLLYDLFAGDGVNENVFAFSNCRAGQRALVVYNNSPWDAGGWLRTSAAKRLGGEQGTLEQISLGPGLQLQNRDDTFYRCRELFSGGDVLLQGADVHQNGLQVSLGPYGYQVLIDIEELVDADHVWLKTWQQTGNRVCHDLDLHYSRNRHADLLAAWWKLLDALRDMEPASQGPAPQLQLDVYHCLGQLLPGLRPPEEALTVVHGRLQVWQKMVAEQTLPAAQIREILTPWLFWSAALSPECELARVIDFGRALQEIPFGATPDAVDRYRLAALLLKLTHLEQETLADQLPRTLLTDQDILAWLELNSWQGVDYLKREKLELLLCWLPLCCRLQAADREECDKALLERIDSGSRRLAQEAFKCGYRLEILLELT